MNNIKYKKEDFIDENGQIKRPLSGFKIFEKQQTPHVKRQRPYATDDAIFTTIVEQWTFGLTEAARMVFLEESNRMAEYHRRFFPGFKCKRSRMTKSSVHSPSGKTNMMKRPVFLQVNQKQLDDVRANTKSITAEKIPIYIKCAMRHYENSHDKIINKKRKFDDVDVIATNQKKVRRDYGLPVQFTAKVPKYQECLGIVCDYEDSFHNTKRHF